MPVGMRADTVAERGTAFWAKVFYIANRDYDYPYPHRADFNLIRQLKADFHCMAKRNRKKSKVKYGRCHYYYF